MANKAPKTKKPTKKNWGVCVSRLFKYQTRVFDAFDELEPRVREICDVYIKTAYKDSPEYPISVGNRYNVDDILVTNDGGLIVTLQNESRAGIARLVIPPKLMNASTNAIRAHIVAQNPILAQAA